MSRVIVVSTEKLRRFLGITEVKFIAKVDH